MAKRLADLRNLSSVVKKESTKVTFAAILPTGCNG